jgi:hypothetical protein
LVYFDGDRYSHPAIPASAIVGSLPKNSDRCHRRSAAASHAARHPENT